MNRQGRRALQEIKTLKLSVALGLGVILAAILVAGFLLASRKRIDRRADDRWPLYAKRLLNEREQVLYWRLVSAFPDYVVLAQVSLSQLLAFEKGSQKRQAIGNRFRQLCADFVLCERSFRPVAVVELDGQSHDRPARADADARKAHALASAGLLLIRANSADLPTAESLRAQLIDGESRSPDRLVVST